MVPEDLAGEYRFVESLNDANAVMLVESVAIEGQYVLKLPDRSSLADNRFHQELHIRSQTAGNRLNAPVRTGSIADGRYFTVTDYRPEGSLYSCLTDGTPLPDEAIRPLVRDLATACRQIHDERDGRQIIHGDIKPSNVLVVHRGSREADWEFRLSDFDSAILLDSRGSSIVLRAHTAGYAAPEVLRSAPPDIPMDYWSMGMLLLTSLLGRHPFGDLPDDQATDLLVNQEWQPSEYISQVEDEACRALMGGLLRRVPDERWGADEVRRWLGDEPDIVVQGLRLLRENAADDPFFIASEPAYTVENVAIALLRSWNTEILLSDELARWLRELSPTAANHVERLQGMVADVALLDFCGTYYPSERMPPFWQGEEVSASNFTSLAARANSGDIPSRECLLAFLKHGHHYFVSNPKYPDVAELVESITQARNEYREARQTIANAGGPSSMPSDDDCWIHATLIACSPVDPRAQLQKLFDPLLIMRRADWFLAFGTDPERINQAQLFVLRSLQEASLLEHVNISHIDRLGSVDATGLWEDTVLPVSQRHLLGSLSVRPEARIDNVAAGETYPPGRVPSIADHIAAALRRGFRWCAQRLRRQREETQQPQDNSRLEMRIVRLTIKAEQKPVSEDEEDELYLAEISWRGAGPNTRLVVANPAAIFPIPRFQIPPPVPRFQIPLLVPRFQIPPPLPADGRILLVIERNAQVYLAGSGLGFWGDPSRSIHILMGRKYPAPVRRLVQHVIPRLTPLLRVPSSSSIQVSQRMETDLGSKRLHTVQSDILRGAGQQPLQRAGVLRRAIGPTGSIGVTTQQREYARRYCAVSNTDWPTFAPYTQKTRLNRFRRAFRRIFRPPRQQQEK